MKSAIKIMLRLLVLMLFCQAARVWAENYFHSIDLDNNKNYQLSWKFNDTDIVFQAKVKTLGYIALGLSKDGTLKNADIFVAGGTNEKPYKKTFYGNAAGNLTEKMIEEWTLISFKESDGYTILTFGRELSGADFKLNITQSTMRVLWGFGNTDEVNASEVSENISSKNVKSLYLLQEKPIDVDKTIDTVNVGFKMENVTIPSQHTTYWCKSFAAPSYNKAKQAVMFSPFVQEGNEAFVHHILVYGCYAGKTKNNINREGFCYMDNMPPDWKMCKTIVYAWAIGGSKLILPKHTGISVGGIDDPIYYILEMHYDNPNQIKGVKDSSGVIMTLTDSIRKYDAGVLTVGHSIYTNYSMIIPPYAKEFTYNTSCKGCGSDFVLKGSEKETPIHLVATFLHGHLVARKFLLRHYRNGVRLPDISYDYNYDFNYQEMRLLKKEITIYKNDILELECVYDTSKKNYLTLGGYATNDEMCLAFLVYYPRIELDYCVSLVKYNNPQEFLKAEIYKNNLTAIKNAELFFNGIKPDIGYTHMCQTRIIKREKNSAMRYTWGNGIILISMIYWLI